ncbi:MAG: hypothetical protein WBZ36_09740 [Candidatus Nitrosopolaris sp.]
MWVYTEPVQKGPCVVFKHLSGHELEKVNRATIEFNKGVEAGHLRTLLQKILLLQKINSTPLAVIPKSCSGWKSATQFTLQQLTARDHNDNNTTSCKGYYARQQRLTTHLLFVPQPTPGIL